MSSHIPVLLKEVINVLNPKPGENFIDATYGSGGHSQEIQKRLGGNGRLLALDWDPLAARLCRTDYCVVENFAQLPQLIRQLNFPKADGLLADLGVSSDQLEKSGRGFSFLRDEPLLMTYNDSQKPVYQILRQLSEKELAGVIGRYGEERPSVSRRIAKAIKDRLRKKSIGSSGQLAELISRVAPRRGKLHPATKTFMALRIYANQELENLEKLLQGLGKIMAAGGRVTIISFHSLEDRLVKNYFKKYAQSGQAQLIIKKPIIPTIQEIRANPRSRSAKLRAIIF